MRIDRFLVFFEGVSRIRPDEWLALCPAHDDHRPSLSIGLRDGKILLHCHAGCKTEDILRSVGLDTSALFNDAPACRAPVPERSGRAETEEYTEEEILKGSTSYHDYRSAEGDLLFRVVRYPDGEDKQFKVYTPRLGDLWGPRLNGAQRVLYNLPEISRRKSEPVLLVEGEKCADALIERGVLATTNPFGAGKWRASYSESLRDREVVILPDNDKAGSDHRHKVLSSLQGVAKSVRVVTLPGLSCTGDVYNYFEAGHSLDDLNAEIAESDQHVDRRGSLISAADLVELDLPEIQWVHRPFLPEGLTLLAGKPKIGKSFLALDVALAVARTGAQVIYLALEDNVRRLKRRLKLLSPDGAPMTLFFDTRWPRLDEGGAEELESLLDERQGMRLVVIDTFVRIRPGKIRRKSPYDLDAEDLGSLQLMTSERAGLGIMVAHHTRKEGSEDPYDLVNGTNGLAGSADTVLVLQRARGRSQCDGLLYVTGRDVEEQELALRREPGSPRWEIVGDASDFAMSQVRLKIREYLRSLGEPSGPKAIAEATGLRYDSVKHLVRKMDENGQLHSTGNGTYELPKEVL